ncbi:MAG TPA: beta-propeller fold lactonase family protein [Gaiellaceae bacterium]|jgi:6-phosphogluconolactonase (cycloisomerase 2 family)|nr:beta-propeller fold lactonase family protein [Gaiellaceae bacterium]
MHEKLGSGDGAVFVQTNEAEGNRVLALSRNSNGQLSQAESYSTGGSGDGSPHLTSQGSVVLSEDGAHLLVTNAGSDELTAFTVGGEGLSLLDTLSSGGGAPKSVAEHDGLVYALNTGPPALAGFRLEDGGLVALTESQRELSAGADPAQVGFSPDGSALVVTDRASNSIVLVPVDGEARLGEPTVSPSAGPTPYGFAFARGGALVVTEAFGAETGRAAASSYLLRGTSLEPVSRSVGNGRSEICWAVATSDGYVFTTNFADGAVSRYAVDADGTLVLAAAVAGAAVEGQPGLRDEDLSADERFLYAIDADAGRVYGWAVEGGELTALGSWNGLPATVAGLAAS